MKKFFSVGPVLIITAAVLWAFDGVLRRSLYSLPPITIVFLEHLFGTIFLLPVLVKNRKQFRILSQKNWILLLWISFFSSVLGTLWFTTALVQVQFISFSVVFLLQKLQPVFVITATALFLREKVTRRYLVWATAAILAAYFVTFPNGVVNFATGSGTVTAALYALGAAFAWGTSTVFSKMALATLPDKFVTALRFLLATIIASLGIFVLGVQSSLPQITFPQLFTAILIALSTGMVAMLLYYKGLAQTEANVATILELVFPVIAIFIDVFVYKNTLTVTQYIAAIVLFFTVYKLSMTQTQQLHFTSKKIQGKGRGKQMGFPTINLEIPANFTLRDGVYSSYVTVAGKKYQGALHYGPIPQFGESKKSLEVYLLDCKDISEKVVRSGTISVEIVRYLRPILKFDSVDALVAQIDLDVQTTRNILSSYV